MTDPSDPKITDLSREFVERLRAHIMHSVEEEPELAVERAVGFASLLTAAALMAFRVDKRNSAIVAAVIRAALRRVGKAVVSRG